MNVGNRVYIKIHHLVYGVDLCLICDTCVSKVTSTSEKTCLYPRYYTELTTNKSCHIRVPVHTIKTQTPPLCIYYWRSLDTERPYQRGLTDQSFTWKDAAVCL